MNLVADIPFVESKSDYYSSWDATFAALDRIRIWLEGQTAKLSAARFRNDHKKGHNLNLLAKRGEKFAGNALSKDRTLALIRKIGIDKAMRAKLHNKAGAPKLLNERQSKIWAMSYNNAQNSSNTTIHNFMRIQVNNNPDLGQHTRTIKDTIKDQCISLPRIVHPSINIEKTKVFIFNYYILLLYFLYFLFL
jgi:hypothetical protein